MGCMPMIRSQRGRKCRSHVVLDRDLHRRMMLVAADGVLLRREWLAGRLTSVVTTDEVSRKRREEAGMRAL